MTPEEELIRAGHANEVLDSALFKEMRAHIKGKIEAQITTAPILDQTLHTRLILMAQLWRAIEQWFEQIAQTGKMAEIQIEQEKRRKTFFFG